jgi:hypothetical protein
MHCLYCDRPLALLKRLTGDGEFCSKEHRKIYQREHSQLALQRLLEAQLGSAGNSKTRPNATPTVKATPTVELEPPPPPVVVRAENQPEPAGFLSDTFGASGGSGVVHSVGLPRLKGGSPLWSKASPKAGRPGPGPKVGVFLTEYPQPRAMDPAVRRQNRWPVQSLVRQLQLGEIRRAAVRIPSGGQPSGAGFLVPQPAASASPGTARRAADPRFAPIQSKGVGAAPVSGKTAHQGIQPAKFVSSLPVGLAAANKVRLPDGAPRWQPIEPTLPQREPGRITLVLGSLLQGPVRPASHDGIPETFEIPFQPVSFPPYSPRMGCLEERLHRTDRIGFSPP